MALMRSPGSSTVRSSVYAGSTCERPDTLHSLTHPLTHSHTHPLSLTHTVGKPGFMVEG